MISRDEMLAVQARGKPVRYVPAEMDHGKAIEKAAKKGLPAPTDFRGEVHGAFAGR